MMNKHNRTAAIACLLLILMLGGCAPPAPPKGSVTLEPVTLTPKPSAAPGFEAANAGPAPFMQKDLTLQGLTLGRSNLQDVVACLGAPIAQETYSVASGSKTELYYEYDRLYLWGSTTDANASEDDPAAFTLVRVRIETADFPGPRGIAVGNTLEQVITQFEDRLYPDVGTQQVLYANHPLQINAAWPDAFVDMPMLLPPYGVVQVPETGNTQVGYVFMADDADAPTALDDDAWVYKECALLLVDIAAGKVDAMLVSLQPLAE